MSNVIAEPFTRPARNAPGGQVYHALNRSVGGMHLFHRDADFEAFQHDMIEALRRAPIRILSLLRPVESLALCRLAGDGRPSHEEEGACNARQCPRMGAGATWHARVAAERLCSTFSSVGAAERRRFAAQRGRVRCTVESQVPSAVMTAVYQFRPSARSGPAARPAGCARAAFPPSARRGPRSGRLHRSTLSGTSSVELHLEGE
jgi:hypothetical protein